LKADEAPQATDNADLEKLLDAADSYTPGRLKLRTNLEYDPFSD